MECQARCLRLTCVMDPCLSSGRQTANRRTVVLLSPLTTCYHIAGTPLLLHVLPTYFCVGLVTDYFFYIYGIIFSLTVSRINNPSWDNLFYHYHCYPLIVSMSDCHCYLTSMCVYITWLNILHLTKVAICLLHELWRFPRRIKSVFGSAVLPVYSRLSNCQSTTISLNKNLHILTTANQAESIATKIITFKIRKKSHFTKRA